MGWTKGDIVREAYSELALAGYVFDLKPEELERGARKLDMMMAFFDGKGIRVGYALASGPTTTDLDGESGVPLTAIEPIVVNLACRLAPGEGKTLPLDLTARAREGYLALMTAAALPLEQQMPSTMPRGAGNKAGKRPFMDPPDTSHIRTGEGGDLDFLDP